MNTRSSLVEETLGTANTTSAPGSNETDLPARGSVTTDGRGLTDVLMVTSSVRMVNGLKIEIKNKGKMVRNRPQK